MAGNSPYDVTPALRPADILLVVPPFAALERPALGVHLLQGVARGLGVEVQVLYANLLFAAYFGERTHVSLSRSHYRLFLGERLFCRSAFDLPPLGHDRGAPIDDAFAAARDEFARAGKPFTMSTRNLLAIEERIAPWLATFVPAIARTPIVGCTTSFEQTGASLAILREVKRRSPDTVTILGGANCEGEMAEGLAAVTAAVDAIFAGESEQTFATFVERWRRGEPLTTRIWSGEPCAELDALPTPDYADYYAQARAWLPGSELLAQARLTYETSRGCWWGAKSHCTFCGLNGQGMAPRAKSPERVFSELRALLAHHPNREVAMADNIMPHAYFKTVVPRLADELPGLHVMYELKANLSLAQVRALAAAGIREVQPGIEALSTDLLALMGKGTTCAQNLALLRYARITGMRVHWNLLGGFPGDTRAPYDETLALLPLIPHLPPPSQLAPVVIDRFSPYHASPERHGVHDVRPIPSYRVWLPEDAPVAKIAYHFEATYASESLAHPELMASLADAIRSWRRRWIEGPVPQLTIRAQGDRYELVDTRGLPGLPTHQVIGEAEATSALVARSLRAPERAADAWARAHQLVVERDRRLVPLALAPPELLADLEARGQPRDQLRWVSA